MRELHWHPNTDEWQYYIEGQARMGVFGASGQARTFDFRAGDVGFAPFAMGHYVENTGDTPMRFLEVFKSNYFADVSLDQWMALTPPELAHWKVDRQVMDTSQDQSARRAGVNHCGAAATRIENVALRCMMPTVSCNCLSLQVTMLPVEAGGLP